MQKSQLAAILRSLTKEEFKEFGRFVHSPYFNNRDEVSRYYDALKEHYPLFRSDKLNEENLFSKVYPGKKFSGVMMRKVFSLTTNLAMSFFAFKSFEDDKLGYNVKLLDRLR